MKTITFVTEITTSGADTRYIPVPARGTVHAVRVACDAVMVNDKTIIFSQDSTAVNTVTAANTAAGTILDGVPTDNANKYLIFDPDSSETTEQVIKMVVLDAYTGSNATLTVNIEFDDSCFVQQDASEVGDD